MKFRLMTLLCCLSFSLIASAQASGGQIRRPVQRQPGNTKNRTVTSPKPSSTTSSIVVDIPVNTPPAIQPILIGDLATYNVVVSTFSILANAQGLCQTLRDKGWGAQIYLDSSNMYRVLMLGTSNEPEAVLYRNHARETYPNAWILKIENGKEIRYETSSRESENKSNGSNKQIVMPMFPGGPSGLFQFLSQNVHYPEICEKNGIQGRVVVNVIVEADGSINEAWVEHSVDLNLDREALRVVRSMPKWIPGNDNGNPIRVKYSIPITFRL